MVNLKEITLKYSDEISNLLGIVEIASKFALSPTSTTIEFFFGKIRNYLSELERQRINKATKRILLGLDKDIHEGKIFKFNRKIVNFERIDHRQTVTQELFEQVLRKCKDEPEDKKQVFISNIYRNILTIDGHNDPLNADWGNKTIQISQNLTYQQLILFKWINVWLHNMTYMLSTEDYMYGKKRAEELAEEQAGIEGGELVKINQFKNKKHTFMLSKGHSRLNTRTHDKIIHINTMQPKYKYDIPYEDYIRLFNNGFGVETNDDIYDSDKQLVIEYYKHLNNIGLIKSHDRIIQLHKEKLQLRERKHLKFDSEYLNKLPCNAVPTILGIYVQSLLFHEDDFTTIPSLKRDIKDLESIIIDPKVAKELEGKYNK